MLNRLFFLLCLSVLLCACKDSSAPLMAPEYLFDAEGQQMISSSINNRKGTISMLYGNELALNNAENAHDRYLPGASYTLVTWKQKPMPSWYGTNMNSEFYAIETLNVLSKNSHGVQLKYQFKAGAGFIPGDRLPAQKDRIHMITSQRAAVRP